MDKRKIAKDKLACLLYELGYVTPSDSDRIAEAVETIVDARLPAPQLFTPPYTPTWPAFGRGPLELPPFPTADNGPPSMVNNSGAMAVIVAYILGMASGFFLTVAVWGIFW